jgi:hypothetical protein
VDYGQSSWVWRPVLLSFSGLPHVVRACDLLLISGSGVRVSDGAPEKLFFIFRDNFDVFALIWRSEPFGPSWCQTDPGHRADQRIRLTLAVRSGHSVAKLWWASRARVIREVGGPHPFREHGGRQSPRDR